jgi:hypothetical protein
MTFDDLPEGDDCQPGTHWHARDTTRPPSRLAPRRTYWKNYVKPSLFSGIQHQGIVHNLFLPHFIPFHPFYPIPSIPFWSHPSLRTSRLPVAAAAALIHSNIRGNVGVLVVVFPQQFRGRYPFDQELWCRELSSSGLAPTMASGVHPSASASMSMGGDAQLGLPRYCSWLRLLVLVCGFGFGRGLLHQEKKIPFAQRPA